MDLTGTLSRLEVLLLVACAVSMIARRFHLPYTVGLTFAGIMLAFFPTALEIHLTKELIFEVFLPPLIFEAAFQMEWKSLRRELPIILCLATLGVVLCAGITAVGLYWIAGWPWVAALLVGMMISATDPVSVIATFKQAGVHGRVSLLVEADSLLNDGTAAVLFAVALAAASGTAVTVGGVTANFLVTVVGGVLCGAVVSCAALLLTGRTDDHLVEITFTWVAAYGSFLLAEHFHLSGVLATLTAGIVLGNVGSLGSFTDRGREAVESFWNYAGFVANSLIFLLIGLSFTHANSLGAIKIALLVCLLVTVGRAAGVYGCCALFRHSALRVAAKHQHILVWGGLRGALALALALGLPVTMPQRPQIITVVFTVVALSVVIQGLTMAPLLRRLGVATDSA